MSSVRDNRDAMSIRFFIEGIPKPKQRPRWSGKFMYSPKSEWEKVVDAYFGESKELIDTPLRVDMTFYMPRPKKHYRTGKYSHILKDNSPVWHTNKPDRDNLEKAVLDCMTKSGLLKDDCIVCRGGIQKKWANCNSGVLIELSGLT